MNGEKGVGYVLSHNGVLGNNIDGHCVRRMFYDGRGIVEEPATTRPLEPSDIEVPDIVVADALLVRVWPAMMTPLGIGVIGWPAAEKVKPAVGRAIADDPATSPQQPRHTSVPATVIAGTPMVKWHAMVTLFEIRVTGSSAAMIIAARMGAGSGVVDEPATRPLYPKETGVPATVTAGAPRVKVQRAMTTPLLLGRICKVVLLL